MRKIVFAFSFLAMISISTFAYNPPVQGENLFYLAHPEMIIGGISTAGGGILSVTPASTTINPALGALEPRITLNLGYSAMFDAVGSDKYGQAFGAGIIVPTDWASFAGELEGVFVPFYNMHLEKSMNLKLSASKQIMDNLYIGIGIGGGVFWDSGNDWMLTADVGALYNFGRLGFLRNFRVAVSGNNFGKVYNDAETIGIDLEGDNGWPTWPCFSTLRAGAAAELIETENFKLGLSLDVTTPFFCNLIFDAGVQLEVSNFFKVCSSWEYNLREGIEGCNSWLPTLGVVFKFDIDTGFLEKPGLARSEISPSVAYKNVDGDINIFSIGTVLRLGELDEEGPDIEIE